jgi:hypothetical protein
LRLALLREAAERLAVIDPEHPERDELAEAFRRVWFASAEWRDWPRELCREAETLFVVFFGRGGIRDSVAKMDEDEAREAAAALRRFLDEAMRSAAPRKPR